MKNIQGKHITVNCWNDWFDHPARMVLELYDNKKYDNTVFVLGSYCFEDCNNLKMRYDGKKLIIYQMEQLFSSQEEHWVNIEQIIGNLRTVDKKSGDEIWDMSLENEAFLNERGILVDKVKPFIYCESLEDLSSNVKPEIDVLFYGNLNKRRANILAGLSYYFYHRGVSVSWISNMGYDTQMRYIEKSKIILNLHHTEIYNRQEQTRIFYALINKKCVISEPSQRNYFGEAIVETDNLAAGIEGLLANDEYKKQAKRGHELFKETQRKMLPISPLGYNI